ncbi:MFS transporter [Arthrobacter sp. NPDC090010]|uniref:MFS transporter n=1 Tax=Arthrobacter sp. NPDC090010 TaxID=3363942 RepID=UPI003827D608
MISTRRSPRDGAGDRHRMPVKTIIAASVGNAVEWFDWTVYATFAVFFAGQIFPGTASGALLATFLTYALAFFFRPLGGILIGRFADTRGRKAGMLLTITLMAGGSLLIAVLPTFQAAGWFAPALLFIARVAQGISLGGEVSNASSYLGEIAPPERRGRYSAFFYMSTGFTVLLASLLGALMTTVLSAEALASWGWRVPFLIGALLGLVGLWLRRDMTESEKFEEARTLAQSIKRPLRATLSKHPRSVLILVALTMVGTLSYYTNFSALAPYAITFRGAGKAEVFWALSLATAVFVALQYPIGALSDRIGRKPILITMTAGTALCTVPLSHLVGPGFGNMFVVYLVGLGLYAMHAALNPAFASELFPTHLRATGIGSWYNLTVASFGGTATLVVTWLGGLGLGQLFFWYVAVAAALACLVVVFVMPETKGKVLD